MALPGLNTEGTNIRVLPQYTPSNTAVDLSALGSGFSQGMQLVGQAQQQRRLRDIIAEEQARRPLRDIVAARQMTEASQPIERMLYSFADELPEGGGIGRYEVRERVNPITGQIEQVNQFVEQVATPAQLAAEQAQAAEAARLAAARELRLDRESAAKVANLEANTGYINSGGGASRGRIAPGEIYQRTIEKNAAELGLTPDQLKKINNSKNGPVIVAKLRRSQDPISGGGVQFTEDELAVMGAALEPAAETESVTETVSAPTSTRGGATVSFQMPGANARPAVAVDNRGLPVFATEEEFNAAYDAGLIPIGTRVNVAGADFDVQE